MPGNTEKTPTHTLPIGWALEHGAEWHSKGLSLLLSGCDSEQRHLLKMPFDARSSSVLP